MKQSRAISNLRRVQIAFHIREVPRGSKDKKRGEEGGKSENLSTALPSGSTDVKLTAAYRATLPCTSHSPYKTLSIHRSTHERNLFLTLRVYIK